MHLRHHARRGRRTAAVASGALLTIALLAGCGEDEPTAQDPAENPSSEPTSSTAEETTVSAPPSTSETDGGPATVDVSVYYAVDTGLVREDTVGVGGDPLSAAVSALREGPIDPDYSSLVEGGAISSVSFDGVGADGVFQVELSDESWTRRDSQTPQGTAELAVQQLLYTLQANANAKAPVEFYLDGEPVPFRGIEGPVEAAPQLEVLSMMNVLSPADGATFNVGDTFTAEGMASSFEATVPWEVRDASGAVVLDGFTTAEGWIERLYPWRADVDVSSLEPGEYTFVAMTDDPSGGEGGGPTEDTKTIVVE